MKLNQQAAKRNDMKSCKILAKEVVNSNRAKTRIVTSKAQLNSLVMQMQQQLGILFFIIGINELIKVKILLI